MPLEAKVLALAGDRKVDEARKLLTEFVASKCGEALGAARVMLRELKSLPIFVEPPETTK